MAIPPPPAPSWAPQQEGVAQIVQLLTEYRQPGANQQQVSTHPTPSTRRMHHPPLRQDPRLVHNLRIIRDLGEFATPFKRPAAPYRGAVHAARGNRTAPRRAGGPPVHLRAYAGSVVAPPLSSKSRHHVNSEMYTVGKRIFSDSAASPLPPRSSPPPRRHRCTSACSSAPPSRTSTTTWQVHTRLSNNPPQCAFLSVPHLLVCTFSNWTLPLLLSPLELSQWLTSKILEYQ